MLTNKRNYKEAGAIFESTTAIASAKSNKNSLIYFHSLVGLAQARQFQGNREEAVTLYLSAVDGFDLDLAVIHPVTLTHIGKLGSALI